MYRAIVLAGCFSTLAFGQHLCSVGVKGGVPLTDIIPDSNITHGNVVTRTFSDSKNYVAGGMIQLNLPLGFAVEADALYRPLSARADTTVAGGSLTSLSAEIHSAEFPILLKYHLFHAPIVKPYVEAGPIFRYAAAPKYLSNNGFALGGGIDFKLAVVHITPEIRYSHWGSDTAAIISNINLPPSNRSQAEFLIGISF